MSALYSWRQDRKATRAHIRHFVRQAIERKQWAATLPADPLDWPASEMSRDMLRQTRSRSVKDLARASLEYARLRAFMPGAYAGYPGDRPARDLWERLGGAVVISDPLIEGRAAAREGVKWWNNPHSSGTVAAYQWDQGHTQIRRSPQYQRTEQPA